jgi:hypothetical protein
MADQAASTDTATTASDPKTGNQAVFDQIAKKIIEQQETIIGPVAIEQAKQISGLKIDWPKHSVDIKGNPQAVIDDLIKQFKELFGQIAVQVSKEAAGSMLAKLPADQIPSSLK